jgi:hypothetical protein
MWYPQKAAFRVGAVDDGPLSGYPSNAFPVNHWNMDSIGEFSIGAGYNTKAKGYASTATGYYTAANGTGSVALGINSTANGHFSIAIGSGSYAGGVGSIALGYHVTTFGDYGTAIGYQTSANGLNSVALGSNVHTNFKTGAFAFGDNNATMFNDADNQMLMRFAGGYKFHLDNVKLAMTIIPSGNIGIGIVIPDKLLHVYGTDVNTVTKIENGGTTAGILELKGGGAGSNSWMIQSEGQTSAVGAGKLNFRDGAANSRMIIDASGNVGIGTSNPLRRLHVYDGASGAATPFAFSPLVVESSGHTYINLLSPDANETAILFGKASSTASGVIMYNNTSTLNGFQFRNNGNLTRMVITSSGNVGIGTLGPTEKLDVAGAVKASQYKFSTPMVSYYSIDPSAFSAGTSSALVEKLIGQGAYISGGSVELLAPINLPHNASIVSVTAEIYDNSATQDLVVALSRRNVAGRLLLGQVLSTGNSGLGSYPFTAPEIIDNIQYSYLIEIFPSNPYSWPTNGDLRIKKIVIAFSVSEAQ